MLNIYNKIARSDVASTSLRPSIEISAPASNRKYTWSFLLHNFLSICSSQRTCVDINIFFSFFWIYGGRKVFSIYYAFLITYLPFFLAFIMCLKTDLYHCSLPFSVILLVCVNFHLSLSSSNPLLLRWLAGPFVVAWRCPACQSS